MKNITEQYQDLLNGKMSKSSFVRSARMSFPHFVSPSTSLNDAVKILKSKRLIFENKEIKEKVSINEAKDTNSGYTYVKEPVEVPMIDLVNPYQLKKGVEFELSKMDDLTGDAYGVALDRALKEMSKDKDKYKDLQLANYNEVKKEDESLQMKEVHKKSKQTVKTDSSGHLKKPVKKDESANVSVKKENKKGAPKGVKQMTEKPKKAAGIKKTMDMPGKEQVLSELKNFLANKIRVSENTSSKETENDRWTNKIVKIVKGAYAGSKGEVIGAGKGEVDVKITSDPKNPVKTVKQTDVKIVGELEENKKKEVISEDLHYKYTEGKEVNTPDGPGKVTKIVGGTLTVELDNGPIRDYQINLINAKEKELNSPQQPVDTSAKAVDLDKEARANFFSNMPNLGAAFEKGKDKLTKEAVMKKLKEFFSKKKKIKKEVFLKNTNTGEIVSAPDGASQNAAKGLGFTSEVPGTRKIKAITSK